MRNRGPTFSVDREGVGFCCFCIKRLASDRLDGVTIVVGDRLGNIYCLEYVEGDGGVEDGKWTGVQAGASPRFLCGG